MSHPSFDEYERQFRKMLRKAYDDGFAAGQQDMKSAILKAAKIVGNDTIVPHEGGEDGITVKVQQKRAPYGLVGKVVEAVLSKEAGLTISEIEERALEYDNRIVPKSIPNELHRKKGDKYRHEGNLWYLMKTNSTEASAGNDTSVDPSEL